MHTLETSQIVSHCNNRLKESFGLVVFHSCIFLLLVGIERFDILWEPVPLICTNDSKTLISSPIKNRVRNKVVFHRHRWLPMKLLPLAGHTSTDHFQQSTLKYV